MTALVPTKGHKFLIDFCANLARAKGGTAHIILGTLKREPVEPGFRLLAFKDYCDNIPNVKLHWLYRDVPQEPHEDPNFWETWRDIVREFVDVQPTDTFVSSELYGLDMSRILECNFMPCNRYREVLPVKGTTVRNDLPYSFISVMPDFQWYLRRTVTIFGPESCGKTTMARTLAETMDGHFLPEWAREYLETVGTEVTAERMEAIYYGQRALQTSKEQLFDKPWVFQDTDLFSTLYYYKLWGGKPPELLRESAWYLKSDMYILMNDAIPFEADPLRYGGDKRESTSDWWEAALIAEKLPYYRVKSTSRSDQMTEVQTFLENFYEQSVKHIKEYKR